MVTLVNNLLYKFHSLSSYSNNDNKPNNCLCSEIKLSIWCTKRYPFNDVCIRKKRFNLYCFSAIELPHCMFVEDDSLLVQKGTENNKNKLFFLEERDVEKLSGRVLKLSRSNKVKSVVELYKTMECLGLRANIHACNSLISCFVRNDMLDNALGVFEMMKTSENISGHTYSVVLKAIASYRSFNEALDLFEELEKEGMVEKHFDVVAYNTTISICGKVNDWVRVLRIWRCMKDNEVAGTIVTYRLLVCIFVRCGQSEFAIDAYRDLVQNGFDPGEDEMQAVIGACSKEGNWKLALEVFENMSERELRPNLITCNALINALGKEGKAKLAFSIYEVMKSFGHLPDDYTWKALLNALYRANRHGDVLHLFEKIKEEQSLNLNLHLYHTCLMSCQRLGFWEKSLKILWEMEASGVFLSSTSYNLVIGACEHAIKPKIALQVYEHMLDQKCEPDSFTLLSLIRSCVWGSLWYEVEELLKVMPDASLYNAAIQGSCLRGKVDLGKKLYGEMRNRNLKPDGKTRALMLQTLQKVPIRRKYRKYRLQPLKRIITASLLFCSLDGEVNRDVTRDIKGFDLDTCYMLNAVQ